MATLCPACGGFHQSQLCPEPGCGGFVCADCGQCMRDHSQPGEPDAWVNFAPDG